MNKFYVFCCCLMLFFVASTTRAYSVTCNGSLGNDLWPGASFRMDIKKLQSFLTKQGYPVPSTGNYAGQTLRALTAYQKEQGIFPTGGLGSMTRLLVNQKICNQPVPDFDAKEKTVTTTSGVLLPVPLVEQSYRLSCESASMEMVLRYRGISVTQKELMKEIGYAAPFVRRFENGKMVWGDPDLGFVGDEKGWVYLNRGFIDATGWGVNPPPVTRVMKTYLPNTYQKDDGKIEDIVAALQKGNPIIFWHRRDDMIQEWLTITTPTGKVIPYTANHVAVVVGYDTGSDGKRWFWINDPTYGRLHIPEETFVRWWSGWFNKMVVSG